MGYLLPILIALGSLGLRELGMAPFARWPLGVFLCLPLPYLASALQRRAFLRGHFRTAGALGHASQALPVLLQYAAVGLFGWVESLEAWSEQDLSLIAWPEPALLLALLPYIGYSFATIDAESRLRGAEPRSRALLRGFQQRMFLTGLGPITAYVLVAALVGRNDLLRIGIEEVALWSLAFTALVGFVFLFSLPTFLRYTWDTGPMPAGPQRDLLQRVARRAKFRCRALLVWETGNLMANAAIVGLLPANRHVFFTDALLAQTDPRQLAAVFAHEIGHAKRGHVLFFLVWSLAFFVSLDTLLAWVEPEGEWQALAWFLGGLVLWAKGFGWASRRIELDADLFSLELLGDGTGITSALQMVGASAPERHTWRHFSPAYRVAFLNRAASDPELGRCLRRRLRWLLWFGVLLLIVGGGQSVRKLAGDYRIERALVDLRLGRYAVAHERFAGLEGQNAEDYRELVGLATRHDQGDWASPAEALASVLTHAQASLDAKDLKSAEGWLALASYLGDDQAASAARWLVAHGEDGGERLPVSSELGPWGIRLRRALQ